MKFYQQALLCAIAVTLTAGQASAQWGGGGYGNGNFGYGGYYGSYLQPFVAAPPYFALHPPVYYGKRYTRPYGVSPFAAPPQLQTNPSYAPEAQAQRALMLSNPYCVTPDYAPQSQPGELPPAAPTEVPAEPSRAPVPPVVQRQIQPLIIDNPYFQAPRALAKREID